MEKATDIMDLVFTKWGEQECTRWKENNSWSMSMDMFRYILGNMYDEYDDWEVQALPAHSALGDCYEEMILLDLILQLFA